MRSLHQVVDPPRRLAIGPVDVSVQDLHKRVTGPFQAQAEGTSSTVIVDQLLDQFRDASA